jgi:hypothetical protein
VRLDILDIDPSNTAIFNGGGPALSRPDQHVAWRGINCRPVRLH